MQWLLENWVWILLIGGMAAMHLFGHRHGGHGGHGKGPRRPARRSDDADDGPDRPGLA
tara:strand:- start:4074 stop:4247 length:174 start_codon:yes stop_codon:yes gene_type:complete